MLILTRHVIAPPLCSSSHLQPPSTAMAGPFQQTTNAVQRAAMWMKGPEQWFAIVRALGMSFLFKLCFQLFTYDCQQIDYTFDYDDYNDLPTPHHSPPHYHQCARGEQGTGIREQDSRHISSPRCVFFFFFFLLFYF